MIFLCEKYGAEKYNTTRGKYNANLVKRLSEDESSGIAI